MDRLYPDFVPADLVSAMPVANLIRSPFSRRELLRFGLGGISAMSLSEMLQKRAAATQSGKEKKDTMREPYLASTSFRTYRDLRSPVIRVSDDGSLGWLIAEVEVQGTQIGEEGVETPVDAVWAWIELYQRDGEDWRLVGNVSNRRP